MLVWTLTVGIASVTGEVRLAITKPESIEAIEVRVSAHDLAFSSIN
jgi:hypothetical protein